jgi:hypothetical protein
VLAAHAPGNDDGGPERTLLFRNGHVAEQS